MITLGTILSLPFFKDFRLVTAKNGMNNPIETTGFFEWESASDIKKSFGKCEFVVTTLSAAKNDPRYADKILYSLISNQVGAIAIKDVYYKSLSDNVTAYSNRHNIPILFFTDTYIDDVLFHVKTAILKESDISFNQEKLSRLLCHKSTEHDILKELIRSINPYFYETSVVCAYISKASDATGPNQSLFNDFKERMLDIKNSSNTFEQTNAIYMLTPYMRGLLLIYTAKEDIKLESSEIYPFLNQFLRLGNDFRIGISPAHSGLVNIPTAIKEAIYANTMCIINREKLLTFDVTAANHILCPICHDAWMLKYYRGICKKLEHNNDGNSKVLINTLSAYVESRGDIGLTSELEHQHRNTIRYRLAKIKRIWGVSDDLNFYNQAYTFVYLNKIYKLLNPIFKEKNDLHEEDHF